ncbi:MAG: hypothetical protein IIC58_12750 [Proteobacteria bacterium]|nr:hypothetical protein [Pseudomonadota bacterium]
MKRILLLLSLLTIAGVSAAQEFSGNIALESLIFSEPGLDASQMDDNITLSFKPKWTGEWNDGDDAWSVEIFLRADNRDEGREHADIRELLWLHLDGDNEWRVGINTMFWGVTESQHLVDVINQVDQVEGIDGEDKLGQPMIHLKQYHDWGVLDFLVLPGFRERTFQAAQGRLRFPIVVDTSAPIYDSSDEDNHVDYAFRFSQTYGDLDLGVSLFKGTNRDPQFDLGPGIPHYVQMTQVALDLLLIADDWIWKLEIIHRDTDPSAYQALTGGFEYTFYGVYDSDINIGSLAEYSYDSRDEGQRGVFDRDLFVGARLAFNDAQSSELLAGIIYDTEKHSQSFRLEGNRRFGDSWKGTIEMQVFSNVDPSDPLAAFEKDDFLLLEIARFF